MNNDLISRSALKEKAETVTLWNGDVRRFISYETIDNAPTVCNDNYSMGYQDGVKKVLSERPQTGWILVSKRLPKEEDYRPCYGLPDGCVMWQTDNGVIGFGWYYNSTKCWSDIYDHPIKAGKVIAWMSLPEAYKEAENEL